MAVQQRANSQRPQLQTLKQTSNLTPGQLEPEHPLIQPYSSCREQVTGRTVWKRKDFVQDEQSWERTWSAHLIAEPENVYEAFERTGSLGVLLAQQQIALPLGPILHQVESLFTFRPHLPALSLRPADTLLVICHVQAGLMSGQSPEQLKAIQVLEDPAQRLALYMVLVVGDIPHLKAGEKG